MAGAPAAGARRRLSLGPRGRRGSARRPACPGRCSCRCPIPGRLRSPRRPPLLRLVPSGPVPRGPPSGGSACSGRPWPSGSPLLCSPRSPFASVLTPSSPAPSYPRLHRDHGFPFLPKAGSCAPLWSSPPPSFQAWVLKTGVPVSSFSGDFSSLQTTGVRGSNHTLAPNCACLPGCDKLTP